jgi:hypothetical protein
MKKIACDRGYEGKLACGDDIFTRSRMNFVSTHPRNHPVLNFGSNQNQYIVEMSQVIETINQLPTRRRRTICHSVVKDIERGASRGFYYDTPNYRRTPSIKPGAKLLMTMRCGEMLPGDFSESPAHLGRTVSIKVDDLEDMLVTISPTPLRMQQADQPS